MFRELQTIRNIGEELQTIALHPHYETMFVSGGKNGHIKYWIVGEPEFAAEIHKAHEQIIWDMAWHPMGHILASASQDFTTRFWTRNRPGDDMNDQYNVNQLPEKERKQALRALAVAAKNNPGGRFGHKPAWETATDEYVNTEMEEPDAQQTYAPAVPDQSVVIPGLGMQQYDTGAQSMGGHHQSQAYAAGGFSQGNAYGADSYSQYGEQQGYQPARSQSSYTQRYAPM
eukprot:UN12288